MDDGIMSGCIMEAMAGTLVEQRSVRLKARAGSAPMTVAIL